MVGDADDARQVRDARVGRDEQLRLREQVPQLRRGREGPANDAKRRSGSQALDDVLFAASRRPHRRDAPRGQRCRERRPPFRGPQLERRARADVQHGVGLRRHLEGRGGPAPASRPSEKGAARARRRASRPCRPTRRADRHRAAVRRRPVLAPVGVARGTRRSSASAWPPPATRSGCRPARTRRRSALSANSAGWRAADPTAARERRTDAWRTAARSRAAPSSRFPRRDSARAAWR